VYANPAKATPKQIRVYSCPFVVSSVRTSEPRFTICDFSSAWLNHTQAENVAAKSKPIRIIAFIAPPFVECDFQREPKGSAG
jgi:hypothetical protein